MSMDPKQKPRQTPSPQGGSVTFDLSSFNILLADDYDFMQALTVAMLKEFGLGGITTCRNGRDARDFLTLSLASQQNTEIKDIDILLTDWMMPDGSGIELIRWIRNHKKDKIRFMPIILVSAFASEEIIVGVRNAGANEALVKPISGQLLASRILAVINNPRSFIKAPDFFGPDRRRKDRPFEGEDRRKTDAEEITQHTESSENE